MGREGQAGGGSPDILVPTPGRKERNEMVLVCLSLVNLVFLRLFVTTLPLRPLGIKSLQDLLDTRQAVRTSNQIELWPGLA